MGKRKPHGKFHVWDIVLSLLSLDVQANWAAAPARGLIIRRIVRWVAAVRQGNADHKTINYPAQFINGTSIGPVRKG